MKYLRAVAFFLVTLLLYLVLALIGWGVDDLPGFFASAPRTGYGAAVLAFSLAVAYQALGGTEGLRGGEGDARKRVRRQTIIGALLVVSLYVALTFLPFADRRAIAVFDADPLVGWVGVILAGFGYAMIFWSGLALGRQYSAEVTIQKDHHLITTGLYRYIRHPRYLGILSLALGLSLVFHSWIGLGAGIPVLLILLLRINDEEALLSREFGQAWESYRRQSWRLIPRLF